MGNVEFLSIPAERCMPETIINQLKSELPKIKRIICIVEREEDFEPQICGANVNLSDFCYFYRVLDEHIRGLMGGE